MEKARRFGGIPGRLVVIFVLLTLGVSLTGFLYYLGQKRQLEKSETTELAAIADLKVREVANWRRVCLDQARVIFRTLSIPRLVFNVLNGESKWSEAELREWMESLHHNFDYMDVLIFDTTGKPRLSSSQAIGPVGPLALEQVREVMKTQKVVLTDLHLVKEVDRVHADLIVPLVLTDNGAKRVVGVLLLRVDPTRYLFPLIESWPVPSRTAESLLVHVEGDEVVYLSKVRDGAHPPMTLRKSTKTPHLVAAKAVSGAEGVVSGIDYSGQSVLAVVRKIPDSPWFLVAEIDSDEVFAPLRQYAVMTTLVVLIVLVAAGAALGLVWRQQAARFYREQYESEKEHIVLTRQYETLTKYANDIILQATPAGAIYSANERALDSYGYAREEIMKLNLRDLVAPDHIDGFEETLSRLSGNKGLVFESAHRQKDGIVFPVEISARMIEVEGTSFLHCIIRDITERRVVLQALRETEERFSTIFRQIPEMVTISSLKEGRYLDVNDAFEQSMGYSRDEVIGRTSLELGVFRSVEDREMFAHGASEGQVSKAVEICLRTKEGAELTVLSSSVTIYIANQPYILTVASDITRRKEAERALRESEERFAAIFRQAPVMTIITSAKDARVLDANEAFERTLGYSREDVIGRTAEEIGFYQNYEDRAKMVEGYRKQGYARDVEIALRAKNGDIVHTLLSATQVHIGGSMCYLAAYNDITERKTLETIVRTSEERFRSLVNQAPIGIFETDKTSAYTYVNAQWCRMTGIPREEAIGSAWDIAAHPEDGPKVIDTWLRNILAGNAVPLEYRIPDGNGGVRWALGSALPLCDEKGETFSFLGTVMDITERKQMEEDLSAEKERLQVTLRSIGDGVITTDTAGCVVMINRVAEQMTGWKMDDAAGKPLQDVFYIINEKTRERCENPVDKVLETGAIVGLANHTVLVARDGREMVIADSGAPIRDKESRIIGTVLVFRDVTEKERLDQEIQKSQRLESVGTLAGGIAHDFNNILTAIIGNISLAKMSAESVSDVVEPLTEAEKASMRAKDLAQQLLTFSKGGAPRRKATQLAEIVRESARFATHGSNARCEFTIADDLWASNVDEGQIGQVVNNLVINAVQATPEGGTVWLAAENVCLVRDVLPLPNGRYVRISVADKGMGIPDEHLRRIFDPYFTTKQKGSGLGLATAYSIVKKHDGHIEVESRLGVGTIFTIYLPACEAEATHVKEALAQRYSGQGKVLVMDDEEVIRKVATRMLQTIGYVVECAPDGSRAVELYTRARASGQPFDLVLMDLTIPAGMGGRETIAALREIDPGVCAIVSSGYSNDPILSHYRDYGFRAALIKPYQVDEMREVLRHALGPKGTRNQGESDPAMA